MPRKAPIFPTLSVRALLLSLAAIALAVAALAHSSPNVAMSVMNGIFIAILLALCLAVGTPQPARSFWLGFAIVCGGFLLLDKLSQRKMIRANFTETLVERVDNWLPPIEHRGTPGTKRYFQSESRIPVYFYRFDESGERVGHGQIELDQAKREGAFPAGVSLEDLPHIDNVPTNYWRSRMLPYWLAGVLGVAGGIFSYVVRCKTALRAEGAESLGR